jgi:hypothetical protein
MTNEEIDERFHDAALDDDGEGWEEEETVTATWDDAELAVADDLDADLDEEEV